jgi:hypothetical protein
MFQKILLCGSLLLCLFVQAQKKVSAVPIIFDSDMGPDYDDVGAITLLHALADSGQAKILATVASTKYDGVACVLNVFNTYFKRPGFPLLFQKERRHLKRSATLDGYSDRQYPHSIKVNDDVPDAAELYRKILSKQPNQSVTIVPWAFLPIFPTYF